MMARVSPLIKCGRVSALNRIQGKTRSIYYPSTRKRIILDTIIMTFAADSAPLRVSQRRPLACRGRSFPPVWRTGLTPDQSAPGANANVTSRSLVPDADASILNALWKQSGCAVTPCNMRLRYNF
jgi:hypothetical protein